MSKSEYQSNDDDLYREWMNSENAAFPENPEWDDYYSSIEQRIAKDKKRKKFIRSTIWSFALLLVAGSLVFFLLTGTNNGAVSPKNELSAYTTVSNDTDSLQVYRLQDSTSVQLYPHAAVTLDTRYNTTNRNLWLKGVAVFDVYKNASLAFVVYTDHLAVKAIGTRFLVNNKKDAPAETVTLTEGIVQVNELTGGKTSKILAVNDVLARNRQTGAITVIKEKLPQTEAAKVKPAAPKSKAASVSGKMQQPEWYAFNNASLPAIFDNLSVIYGVKIRYDKSQIEALHFIGKFDKSDSFDHVIQVITSLNELQYRKKADGSYEVYK